MQNPPVNILSTALLPPATLTFANARGIEIDAYSFIETMPVNNAAIARVIQSVACQKTTVVFTSKNAVLAVLPHLTQTPPWIIYCMEGSTQQFVAQYFGEEAIAATAPNATLLAEKIITTRVNTAITFFCGNKRLPVLPQLLAQQNIIVEEVVVYNTIETPVSVNKAYRAIAFFSPSAVRSFHQMNTIDPATTIFAMGATTASAIRLYAPYSVPVTGEWQSKSSLMQHIVQQYTTTPKY